MTEESPCIGVASLGMTEESPYIDRGGISGVVADSAAMGSERGLRAGGMWGGNGG